MNPAANWCRSLRGSWDRPGRCWNAFPCALHGLRAMEGAFCRHDGHGALLLCLHRASDATGPPHVVSDWTVSLGRCALGVFHFLPSARVSFRILDSYLDVL